MEMNNIRLLAMQRQEWCMPLSKTQALEIEKYAS